MSRVFVCLFVLFILSIAIRFGDCENTRPECKDEVTPGSDKTKLSHTEKFLQKGLSISEKMGNLGKKDKDKDNKEGSFSNILDRLGGIARVPGTKWCGNGDSANSEDDLGKLKDLDACCRAHDNCNNDIPAGKTEVNLMNNGIFTRSSCSCDEAFYICLKNANNLIATAIGKTYFSVLKPQCFRCTCPTADCELHDGTDCKDHCIKYEWFDNKEF